MLIYYFYCQLPVLLSFFSVLSGKQSNGYILNTLTTNQKEKFSVLLTCAPIKKSKKKNKTLTIWLSVEVSMVIPYWPVHFQHPYPRRQPHSQIGKKILSEMKDSTRNHKTKVTVSFKVKKVVVQNTNGGISFSRPLQRAPRSFASGGRTVRRNEELSQEKARSRFMWKSDFREVEEAMLNMCLRNKDLKPLIDALSLYHLITSKGKRLLPQMDVNTTNTIMLWLIKKHGGIPQRTVKDWLVILVERVHQIMESGFCSSFCQPNINVWKLGKVKNKKLKIVEEFIECLKDPDGAPMVKHMVGIYGRQNIITHDPTHC